VSGCGLVGQPVGSSGRRPPVGGVPGSGRSLDREPLSWLSWSRWVEGGWGCAGVVGGSGGGRGRWLFENCTVDASIFVKIKTHPLGCGSWFSAVLLLLKFLRAQGGCLGTRSRRRTW